MQFQKVTKSSQYKRILSKGKRYVTPSFAAFYRPNQELTELSVGIIASRKVGGAVSRNFCKRRIRAALRNLPSIAPSTNHEVVIIARSPLISLQYSLFEQDLLRFFNKIS